MRLLKELMLLGCLGFFGAGSAHAGNISERHATRPDGSAIQYYLVTPEGKSTFPVLLFLQGSTCISVYPGLSQAATMADQTGIAVLQVEKVGLNKTTTSCPQEYLDHNSVDQRVNDLLRVVNIFRSESIGWNHELIIMGHSEGATLAPIVATFVPETKKVVSLAGGGGMTMAEELDLLLQKELTRGGKSQEEIQIQRERLHEAFASIKREPVTSKTWYGDTNTYYWWNSILWLKPVDYLLRIDVPVLMIQGTEDDAVPVESARIVASQFQAAGKSNLTYIEMPGLDHHWADQSGQGHSNEVMGQAIQWVLGF